MRLAFRGGASNCLAYAKVIKEIYQKDLFKKIEELSAASGGCFFAGLLAQNYPTYVMREFFLDLPKDDLMVMAEKIELKEYKQPELFFRSIELFVRLQTEVYKPMMNVLEYYFDWNRCKVKTFIAVFPFNNAELLFKQFGFKLKLSHFNKLNKLDIDWVLYNPYQTYEFMSPYYLSDDGIYKFKVTNTDYKTGIFAKVSDQVIPMPFAIYSSFYNPILPAKKVKINGTKTILIDGGAVNNDGNLPFYGKDYIQISCGITEPPEVTKQSAYPDMFNDFFYSFNKAKQGNYRVVKPEIEKKGFFSFQEEHIKREFFTQPSNIL